MNGTIIALVGAAFAIWAMISVAQSKLDGKQKAIWFAVVILLPVLGPLIYWFNHKKREEL